MTSGNNRGMLRILPFKRGDTEGFSCLLAQVYTCASIQAVQTSQKCSRLSKFLTVLTVCAPSELYALNHSPLERRPTEERSAKQSEVC